MSSEQVLEKLQEICDRILPHPIPLSPDICASDVRGWDSLTHISIIVSVEKVFSIRFQSGEVELTKNIGEFVELIMKKLSK